MRCKNTYDNIKQYSNAAEVKAENIPQSIIDDLADLFYGMFARLEEEEARRF